MIDFLEILKILKIISAALLLLLSVYLLSRKKGNRASHLFLAVFFISRASILLTMLFWEYEVVYRLPGLAYISTPFLFLYAPMLYLYTESVTRPDFRFKQLKSLHLLPFMIRGVILFFRYYVHSQPLKMDILQTRALYHPIISSPVWLYVQNLIYMIACFYLLYQYQLRLRENFSAIEKVRMKWLTVLLGVFFVWKGIFISGYLYQWFSGEYGWVYFQIFIEFTFLIYVCLLVYKALEFPELFRSLPDSKKYQTSPLTAELIGQFQERIEACMQQEKLYLNPALTLSDLAREAGIPARYISQVLNETMRKTFYEYINQYRIEESKRLLSDPAFREKTILAIIYVAGFNSKSVFNSAFKKYVGMTPCEYRLQHNSLSIL